MYPRHNAVYQEMIEALSAESFDELWRQLPKDARRKLTRILELSPASAQSAHQGLRDEGNAQLSMLAVLSWWGHGVQGFQGGQLKKSLMSRESGRRFQELLEASEGMSSEERERHLPPRATGELGVLSHALSSYALRLTNDKDLQGTPQRLREMREMSARISEAPMKREGPLSELLAISATPAATATLSALHASAPAGSPTLSPPLSPTLSPTLSQTLSAPLSASQEHERSAASEETARAPSWVSEEISELYERSQGLARSLRAALKGLEEHGAPLASRLLDDITRYREELTEAARAEREQLPEELSGELPKGEPVNLKGLSDLKALSRRARRMRLLQGPRVALERLCALKAITPLTELEETLELAREWLGVARELQIDGDQEELERHVEAARPFEALLTLVEPPEDLTAEERGRLCALVAAGCGASLLTSLHRIGPRGVDLEGLVAEREELRERLARLEELTAQQGQELSALSERLLSAEAERDEATRANFRLRSRALTRQRPRVEEGVALSEEVAEALCALSSLEGDDGKITPEQCLRLLEHFYPERVAVLESAYRAARGVSHFQKGAQLWELLSILATDYVDLMNQEGGGGDLVARDELFGEHHFSPSESEQTINNTRARVERTFQYNGEALLMLRHLKIGTSNNTAHALRVHFEWIASEGRVVIGHCGGHLYLKDYA